jgi:hypothetical protein
MVVHPRCPCSQATIGELAILMTRSRRGAAAYVLFYSPLAWGSSIEETTLWRSAAAIPGVVVLRDVEGAEARRFGVSTSGQALVYNRAGALLFSGGITSARGHMGDNAGLEAILSFIKQGAGVARTPVYGCSLETPSRRNVWKR